MKKNKVKTPQSTDPEVEAEEVEIESLEKRSGGQVVNYPRMSIFLVPPEELIIIGRDTEDGEEHPRYDVRAHMEPDEHVVNFMMQNGVLETVLVLKINGRLEALDGRQRIINAREANRRLREQGKDGLDLIKILVRVLPKGLSESKQAELIAALNEHRFEDTALGRGQKASKMLLKGNTEGQVAEVFRISVPTLKNYLSLNDLVPELKREVASGKMPASKAYVLATKTNEAQYAYMKRRTRKSDSGPPKRRPSGVALRKVLKDNDKFPELVKVALRFALGDLDLEKFVALAQEPAEKAPEETPQLRVIEGNGRKPLDPARERYQPRPSPFKQA